MRIIIPQVVLQTQIFIGVFLAAVVLSIRKKTTFLLTKDATQELKGFAICGVLFAHLGYAFAQDGRFLFPLSICAGVAVNLFLFLSGYGLTVSAIEQPLAPKTFYKKRLLRLFVPFWIVLALVVFGAIFLLKAPLSLGTVVHSFLGLFPRADLYQDLNSPLWYFTFILGYYLLFPWIFRKQHPLWSAVGMLVSGLLVTLLPLPVDSGVQSLYAAHVVAFPLGMFCAGLTKKDSWFAKTYHAWKDRSSPWLMIGRASLLAFCTAGFVYLSFHAAIGQGWLEQALSLISMICVLGIFLLKPFESRFLILMGVYSYEIYLFHWPLLYHYDLLYRSLPASLATVAYFIVFLGLAWGLQQLTNYVFSGPKKSDALAPKSPAS